VERFKEFIASYLTGFLSILLVLNIIIVFFSMMGIGWQQFIQISNNMFQILQNPSLYLSHESHQLNEDVYHETKHVSGLVTDPNVQLVCSDESFSIAASKVRTSVVNITCDSIKPPSQSASDTVFDDPTPNLRILGGIGSGLIIDSRGYILTCLHVIQNAKNVYVIPFGYSEKKIEAEIIATDTRINMAILRIQCPYKLPEATIGDSDLMEIADIVLAIGNPFGLEQSVTHGIVSDNRRDLLIKGVIYQKMIQTDAPINRGSSGGPLVNMNGEVIGINMAIYSSTGVYNGVSFALPINQVKRLMAKYVP